MKKGIHITVTVLFLMLIFGFGIAFWILPDSDFSPEENRPLEPFPNVTAERLLEKKVTNGLIQYYSDQFPLRNGWIRIHTLGELVSFRGESGGILLGKNGQLAARRFDARFPGGVVLTDTDQYSEDHVREGLSALVALEQTLEREGIPLCVLLPPRTIDVTIHDFSYPSEGSDTLNDTIHTVLAEGGVNSVELLSDLRERHDKGEYVYYRTDHHWTTRGAYIAYTAVMKAWGMEKEILPESHYTVRNVPDFYGTAHSFSGMFFVPPDTLEIWEAPDDSRYTVCKENNAGEELPLEGMESGFISESYLSEKDKYGAFLGGTHSVLHIRDKEAAGKGESRPRLLLARDSFANSMVPFLARHFDICMVNLSGGKTNLSELCEQYDCQRVLVVCNWENLITSDCVAAIE